MKFLRQFLGYLAAVVLVWIATVVVVNPRGEFPSRRFPWVLPNSRRVKLELYDAAMTTGAVQGVILGSSRSMKLSPELFTEGTGKRFFNFAVFSGTIEDDLAIVRLMIRRGTPPAQIILGLEESSLEPGEPNQELDANFELSSALAESRPTPVSHAAHWLGLVKGTFTMSYAANVARSIHLKFAPELPIHAFTADGVVRYVRKDSEIAAGADSSAEITAALPRWKRTPALHVPDSARTAKLDELLRVADSTGTKVTVWFTPLHPTIAAILEAKPEYQQSLSVVRQRVAGLAQTHHAAFVDLNDSRTVAGPTELWYDAEHYGDRFAARVVPVLIAAGSSTNEAR